MIGRGIRPEDDRVDAPHVVVLSHRLWQAAFGGDPSILRRTIRVNALPAIVVGVTRPSFEGIDPGRPCDVLLPIVSFAAALEGPDRLATRILGLRVMDGCAEPVTPVTSTIPRSASASFEITGGSCSVSTVGMVNGITRMTIMKLDRCRRMLTRKRPTPATPHEQS